MEGVNTGGDRVLTFKGSRYWESNVCGAVVAGLAGGIVMVVVATMIALNANSLKVQLLMGGWIAAVVLSVVGLFPGNVAVRFPYAVVLEKGKGLRLQGAFKTLYIPIQDVRDVRPRLLQGFVVRLKRRHGILTDVVIHKFFGEQGRLLADAIQQEIQRRAS